MKRINALRSQRFVIRVRENSDLRKVFTLGFLVSDGSIWLSVPYFSQPQALLGEITIPAGQAGPVQVSAADAGKVTAQRVKLSHHRSGECLFSLTGKVESVVRRQSMPLNLVDDHIATLQLEDLSAFTEDTGDQEDAPWEEDRQERTLTFEATHSRAGSLKFVLRAFTKRLLRQRLGGREAGPWVHHKAPGDPLGQGVIVAPPVGTAGAATFVLLTWEAGKRLSRDGLPRPGFILTGGFDPGPTSRDIAKPTSCLVMISPPENFDELLNSIGTIDL